MISKTPKLKIEKRLYLRVEAKLALRVIANGYDFSTTTQNLSCLGAYCRIKQYVPPFTKLLIKLNLPVNSPNAKDKFTLLECKGVIVRTEDEKEGGFNIAIFFNGIEDAQRHKISQYLKQFIPAEPLQSFSSMR
jgi:hypothetical protein